MIADQLNRITDWGTFAITLATAVVGIYGYVRYRLGWRKKSKRLEAYLLREKVKTSDRGQRSVLQVVRDVGLTEEEAIRISFENPRVGRRVKLDGEGLAKQLLFEYQDDSGRDKTAESGV